MFHFEDQSSDAEDIKASLLILDTGACGFAHERSESVDAPLCPDPVCERKMGCAHGANKILYRAVDAASRQGVLSKEEDAWFREELGRISRELLRLDVSAGHAYEVGDLPDWILEGQKRLIAQKHAIRIFFLEILENHDQTSDVISPATS